MMVGVVGVSCDGGTGDGRVAGDVKVSTRISFWSVLLFFFIYF